MVRITTKPTWKVVFQYDDATNVFCPTEKDVYLHILFRALCECNIPVSAWHYTDSNGKRVDGFTADDYNPFAFEEEYWSGDWDDILGIYHNTLSIDDLVEMVERYGRWVNTDHRDMYRRVLKIIKRAPEKTKSGILKAINDDHDKAHNHPCYPNNWLDHYCEYNSNVYELLRRKCSDEWGKECRDFALEYVRDEYLKHGIE